MTTIQNQRTNRDARAVAIAGFAVGAMAVATATLVETATLVAVVSFGSAGRGGNDGTRGVVPPIAASPSGPAASATPRPTMTAEPTTKPTARPTDGATPSHVRIATTTGAIVTLDVVDETSTVVEARSGKPADGVSVDSETLKVENVDPSTLRLTWSDYAIDNALTLLVSKGDGHLRLVLVRPEPSGSTDAMAMDRELLLRFARPVAAADVVPFVQDGLDTAS